MSTASSTPCPFDTHPIVLYYNKDKLAAAGLIGDNGLPKDLNGIDNFKRRAEEAQGRRHQVGHLHRHGRRQLRIPHDLFAALPAGRQRSAPTATGCPATMLDKLANAVQVDRRLGEGRLQPAYTDYPTTVALFTSGDAAMMINGVWEVPTMIDLEKQGKLFNWGAIELPVFFNHPCTYSDSHTFAIPNNVGKPQTPEKHAAVLEVIKWMEEHSLFWATAGHIPANKAVTDSAEYKAMQPQATYAPLTANMIYDPKSKFAGVASPLFDAAGNAFTAAINGEVDASDGGDRDEGHARQPPVSA